jgi:Protein of unknown function (DUF2892)
LGVCCVYETYQFQPKEKTVKINIGSADRKLRAFVVAPVLVVAGLLVGPAGWLAIVLYALAVVMAATSAISFCPLYALLGLRTLPQQNATAPAAEGTVSQ